MSRMKSVPVVQHFSDEYIERCRELSPQDIVGFLEEYRTLLGAANRDSQPIDKLYPFSSSVSAGLGLPVSDEVRRPRSGSGR